KAAASLVLILLLAGCSGRADNEAAGPSKDARHGTLPGLTDAAAPGATTSSRFHFLAAPNVQVADPSGTAAQLTVATAYASAGQLGGTSEWSYPIQAAGVV